MDQVKIGKFIAERRKKVNLTQMQLAEKMGVSDRAVSKWETGRAMPDSSLMLDLCEVLQISVNDLLNGEVVTMEEKDKKTEKALLEMVKEKEKSDRRLLVFEWVIMALSAILLVVSVVIAGVLPMEEWQQITLIVSCTIPAVLGFVCAMKIEQVAGYYKCEKCGHTYVPTFKAASMAMHMGRTKYMKCPKCGEKSWQKKVVSKEE